MKIGILGMGYVGIVSGACLLRDGHEIVGVDLVTAKVNALSQGRSIIQEPNVSELLESGYKAGRLSATSNPREGVVGKDMDVFFMCSRPLTETFGLVVIEAMAASVPVVAFNNDAMPEIIENGKTGFTVPEGDTTLAAEKILHILNDSQLSDEFKSSGRIKVFENFDIPILINRIEYLYKEILRHE